MAVSSNRKRNRVTEITNGKRAKKELCRDVLELIFRKLNFLDLTNSKLVCSSWNSIAKHVQTSYVPHKKVPSLMIPPLIYGDNFSLCDIVDKRNYNVKTNMAFAYSEESCYEVGSSHGCLIFLDKKFVPFVLNPFTGSKLELPEFTDGEEVFMFLSQKISPDIGSISYELPSDIRGQIGGKSLTQSWLRNNIARKVILSSDPFGGNKFSAVLICHGGQLAYFNVGQVAWTLFDPEEHSDVMFHENRLYAFETHTKSVEVWDFSGSAPVKVMKLEPEIPVLELWERYHIYLIKLNERILLVTRNVADNMDDDGNGVMHDDGKQVTGCPSKYRTVSFDVFELDMQKQQWVEVDSLEGYAIFLGGDHTISVSTHQQEFVSLEDDSIYFTDDSWERMYKNSYCGGHDRGVFNIKDRKVKVCDDYGFCMMKPSPCWIVANPW